MYILTLYIMHHQTLLYNTYSDISSHSVTIFLTQRIWRMQYIYICTRFWRTKKNLSDMKNSNGGAWERVWFTVTIFLTRRICRMQCIYMQKILTYMYLSDMSESFWHENSNRGASERVWHNVRMFLTQRFCRMQCIYAGDSDVHVSFWHVRIFLTHPSEFYVPIYVYV